MSYYICTNFGNSMKINKIISYHEFAMKLKITWQNQNQVICMHKKKHININITIITNKIQQLLSEFFESKIKN